MGASEGRRVGDYLLTSRLGAGGMGEVWLGAHVELGFQRAIKLLPQTADAEVAARFEREAAAMAALDHPHIVKVHACGRDARGPYLVMDHVEGRSLSQLLVEERLPVERAVELTNQLALGLAHMHARGVFHRDVKPGNVLVDAAGQARWIDFGLARLTGMRSLTETGQLLGTPAYMSPEQAEGGRLAVDARTDVYGLGALLYHCLTGKPPFHGGSVYEVLAKLLGQPPTPVRELAPDVPEHLAAACERALAKRPADRFASAEAFRAALEAGPAEPHSRLPRALGAVALLALALAVGGLLAAWARPTPSPVRGAPSPEPPPGHGAPSPLRRGSPPATDRTDADELSTRRPRQLDLGARVALTIDTLFEGELYAVSERGLFRCPDPLGAGKPELVAAGVAPAFSVAGAGGVWFGGERSGVWVPWATCRPAPAPSFREALRLPGAGLLVSEDAGGIYRVATLPPPAQLTERWAPVRSPGLVVRDLATDGSRVAVSWGDVNTERPDAQSRVTFYDLEGNVVNELADFFTRVNVLATVESGRWLGGSSAGHVYLLREDSSTDWNPAGAINEYERRITPYAVRGLARVGDTLYVLSGRQAQAKGEGKGELSVWNWSAPGKPLLTVELGFYPSKPLVVGPGQEWLAFGGEGGHVWVYPLGPAGRPGWR